MASQLQGMSELNKTLIESNENIRNECESLRKIIKVLTQQNNDRVEIQDRSQNIYDDPRADSPMHVDTEDKWTKVSRKNRRRRALSGSKHCGTDFMNKSPVAPVWSVSPVPDSSSPKSALNPLCREFVPKEVSKEPKIHTKPKDNFRQRRRTLPAVPPAAIRAPSSDSSGNKSSADPSEKGTEINKVGPPTEKKPRLTLLGSSMARDTGTVLSNNLPGVDTCVLSVSGLTVNGALKQLPPIIEECEDSDTVVFQLGTVDIKQNNPFIVASNYSTLLDRVHDIAPRCNVVISAVPYRVGLENTALNGKIDQLNSALRLMCTRSRKCNFWDVNPSAIQSNYKADMLHFNYHGSMTYAMFLSKKVKQSANFTMPPDRVPV
jgi:lysophospholipase L1-like esterase